MLESVYFYFGGAFGFLLGIIVVSMFAARQRDEEYQNFIRWQAECDAHESRRLQ